MALRFRDRREVASADGLDAIALDQVREAGKRYDGDDRPADERIGGDPDDGPGLFGLASWRVVDGDRHVYDAWLYMVDSGTIFAAGTTTVVAELVQFGLECADAAVRREIGPALVEAKLLPATDMSYAAFAALLAAQP